MLQAIERRGEVGRGTFYYPEKIAAAHYLRSVVTSAVPEASMPKLVAIYRPLQH